MPDCDGIHTIPLCGVYFRTIYAGGKPKPQSMGRLCLHPRRHGRLPRTSAQSKADCVQGCDTETVGATIQEDTGDGGVDSGLIRWATISCCKIADEVESDDTTSKTETAKKFSADLVSVRWCTDGDDKNNCYSITNPPLHPDGLRSALNTVAKVAAR